MQRMSQCSCVALLPSMIYLAKLPNIMQIHFRIRPQKVIPPSTRVVHPFEARINGAANGAVCPDSMRRVTPHEL